MKFVNTYMLWLMLVTLPLLACFLWWAWQKKQFLISQFVRSRLLADLTVGVSRGRQKLRMALLICAVTFILLALARPQWGFTREEARQRGIDIVIAVDTSKSLTAEDLQPNRFTRAKLAAWELVRLAKTDRLGLVAFAGTAFLQLPLTLDEDAFRQSLEAISIGIIPQGGSALANCIETSMTAFAEDNDNHKVIVILTDGEDHEGAAIEAAKAAAEKGVRIFTIGVGTPEGALLSIMKPDGSTEYLKDSNGAVVMSRLNENLLKEIATAGNGFYLPLQGAKTMETLYERGLEPLPKSENTARIVQRFHERFQWPLGFAIILLIVEFFVPDRKRPPAKETGSTNAASLQKAALVALLFLIPISATASPRSAARNYEKGEFSQAYEDYRKLLDENPDDPHLNYNAGASAYQQGNYDEASQLFNSALRSEDLDLQQKSYYGLGNSLYYNGEKAADPSQKMKTWTDAVKNYESALKLNPSDENAQYNLDVVKKRLEELKQQQQEQQEDQQQNQEDSQENEDEQQQNSDEQNEEQENQEDQQQQQQDSQDPQEQPQDSDEESDEQQSQQPGEQEGQDETQEQRDSQPQALDGEEAEEQEQQQQAQVGKMTEEQAQQLLDAIRSQESSLMFAPTNRPSGDRRFFKDW